LYKGLDSMVGGLLGIEGTMACTEEVWNPEIKIIIIITRVKAIRFIVA